MRVINPSVIAEAIFESDASLIYCVIDEDTGVAIAEGSISRTVYKNFCSSTNIAVDPPSLTLSEEASQLSGAEIAQQTCPPNSDDVAQPVSQAERANRPRTNGQRMSARAERCKKFRSVSAIAFIHQRCREVPTEIP